MRGARGGSVGRLAGADEFHQAHDPLHRVGGGSRQGCRDHQERHPQGLVLTGNRHAVGSKGARWDTPSKSPYSHDYMRTRGVAGGHKAASGSHLAWLSARPKVETHYLHESLAGGG
jgi:hypothetical protein